MAKSIKVYNGNEIKASLLDTDILNVEVAERQNDESTLTFEIDISNEKYQYVKVHNALFVTEDKAYIHKRSDDSSEETHSQDNSKLASINLVERHYELADQYVTAYNSTTGYTSIDTHMVVILSGGTEPLIVNGVEVSTTGLVKGSAKYALTALLYGSGWSVGTVDVEGIYDLETDKVSRLENIKKVIEIWGGILVVDSKQKIISLRNEETFQEDNGFEIKVGQNAKVINRQISRDIVTKAYVYGKDNLNIKSVNGGLEYITNFETISDVYEDILTNNDLEEPTQLKNWGIKELKKLSKIRSKIAAEFIDKSYFDGGATFKTNDIVTVADKDISLNYKARVIYKKYKYFQPYICVAEVGDNLNGYEDVLNNVVKTTKTVNNIISTNKKISSSNILTPEKTDVTTIIRDTQSAINQNSEAIEILQENQISVDQVDSIITESITASDGQINLFVTEKTELNSHTYSTAPDKYTKNDIFIYDRDYITSQPHNFQVGQMLLAKHNQNDSLYSRFYCNNGEPIQFANGEFLEFPNIIFSDWDKKDKYQTDKDLSASLKIASDSIIQECRNGALSASTKFSADKGQEIFNGDLSIYDKPESDSAKQKVFYFDRTQGKLIIVGSGEFTGKVTATGGIFGNLIIDSNGNVRILSNGNAVTYLGENLWNNNNSGLIYKADIGAEEYRLASLEMQSDYNMHLFCDGDDGKGGIIKPNFYVDTNLYANGVQVTSDRQLKKDIKKNTSYALDKLKGVNFYGYTLNKPITDKDGNITKYDNSYSTKIGLMHDEAPEDIATTDQQGDKHIDLYASVSFALKAIQELNKKVDRQALQLADLKQENAELKKQLKAERLKTIKMLKKYYKKKGVE